MNDHTRTIGGLPITMEEARLWNGAAINYAHVGAGDTVGSEALVEIIKCARTGKPYPAGPNLFGLYTDNPEGGDYKHADRALHEAARKIYDRIRAESNQKPQRSGSSLLVNGGGLPDASARRKRILSDHASKEPSEATEKWRIEIEGFGQTGLGDPALITALFHNLDGLSFAPLAPNTVDTAVSEFADWIVSLAEEYGTLPKVGAPIRIIGSGENLDDSTVGGGIAAELSVSPDRLQREINKRVTPTLIKRLTT